MTDTPPCPTVRHRRLLAAVALLATTLSACSASTTPEPDVVARGRAVYEASCVSCHGGPTGGAINEIPPPHNAQGHTWHHPDCLLQEIVREGMDPRPGAAGTDREMPAFGDELSDEEIDAVLTYISTLWTDEQRESQAEVTAQGCG